MAINVNITSMKDFDKAIEKIGALQEKIEQLKKEHDSIVELVSDYALDMDISEGVAGDYTYELVDAPRAMRLLTGVKLSDAIALLKAQPETTGYVLEDVDKKKLKKAFERSQATRKAVEKYGFYFTEPEKKKIKVEVRE